MNATLQVLIVEDEFLTADTLKNYLEEFGYAVSGMARDAQEALSILDKGTTDLAILDMNIQGARDGIWLAHQINEKHQLPFLFLTAYSDNATVKSAVETKPYGYLVKPFNKSDIYTAIEVALEKFHQLHKKVSIPEENQAIDKPLSLDDYLFVKEKNGYQKIGVKDILYIKSELKYVEIHLPEKKYVLRYSLSELDRALPESFIQIHRSYIVNKESVEYIGANYVLVNKEKLPISLQRKEAILKAFKFL